LGSIGGSSISSVVAKGQGRMRSNLLYRLAGEILSGVKYEGYKNADMERGQLQEQDARNVYAMEREIEVYQIGITKEGGNKHYSEDGFVGKNGLIEIKAQMPSVYIETIITEKIDTSYYRQINWGMSITQREYCDFIAYSPLVVDRPIWIKRFERDEKLIKEMHEGADKFIMDMAVVIKKVKGK